MLIVSGCSSPKSASDQQQSGEALVLPSKICPLNLDGLFYETQMGRTQIPVSLISKTQGGAGVAQARMPDGRVIKISVTPDGNDFTVRFSAEPDKDIIKWGLAVDATHDEYFTGIMERVVDGPQQASWAEGITSAMNLRGQTVDMILKPTTSVYAPFYISSRGYAAFAKTDWPGFYDFCSTDPQRVKIEFEGPSFEIKFFTADDPGALVKAHALEAGPPFMPPKWMFTPWRWRDEHKQRTNYYDGTPVTGPFNSETMEDVLMMKAYGIPCGVYWIDRPWGPGKNGCDDFEIDEQRLPNFKKNIEWLNDQNIEMVMWIAPFFQGEMETNALERGYTLPGQKRTKNNYPLVDFTNPEAKKYWQDGVAKFLKMGVAGFKLDRAEEQIPESGDFNVFDGRSIRENRNAYPPMYVKATYEIAKQYRDDFVCMPRAAYTGSSPYGAFWGGDIGGTAEGLRASIIAIQRSAVMGYPNWGADTCGYNKQSLDQEVYTRWLAFSCFNPIMEVGPTKNVGFWNMPRNPSYDSTLIAAWRMYARLHQRLEDYGYEQAKVAHKTGMPIVRPLFLVDPKAPQAWDNWWTFQYGPDLLISPVWEKGKRTQEVYLPAGEQWRNAWNPDEVHNGGQTIKVNAQMHEIPIFIRVGSNIELGDLNKEWAESFAIAEKKPDLAALEKEVNAWFEKNKAK